MWQTTVQQLRARRPWRYLLRGVFGLALERHHAATRHYCRASGCSTANRQSRSPGLAALLGFIPGVGAMYNGEYAKGFIHVLIFATLIWMAAHVNGIFGLGIAAFVIYMPIEAYQTARAREMGLPAPDPFGLNHLFSSAGPPPNPARRRSCRRRARCRQRILPAVAEGAAAMREC